MTAFNLFPLQVNATKQEEIITELKVLEMLQELEETFKPGCATLKAPPVHLGVRPSAQPQ